MQEDIKSVRKPQRKRARSRSEWLDVYRSIRHTASEFEKEVIRFALRVRDEFPTPEYEIRRVIDEARSQSEGVSKDSLNIDLNRIFKESLNERSLNYLNSLTPPENYNPRPSISQLRDSFKQNNYFVSEDDIFTIHQAISSGRPIKVDGPPGTGKAQPLGSLVITPVGPKKMGDIKVGDLVCTPDGGNSPVIGVFPQGEKDIYRIYFNDDTFADCCENHLWKVEAQCGYRDGVMDTKTLMTRLKTKDGKRLYSVPMTKPVSFNKKDHLIDPYFMGILLSTGGLGDSFVKATICEEEILSQIRNLIPTNYSLKESKEEWGSPCDYLITRKATNDGKFEGKPVLTDELYRLGLMDKYVNTKFVPEEYLIDSVDNRLRLLQGLMDGDGTVSADGSVVSYTTASEQLAKDFQFLIQSFGGKCTISSRIPTCTYKGEKLEGKLAYNCCISMLDMKSLFSLSRKKDRVIERTKYPPKRMIDRIEFIGRQEAQCIMIDHSEHLYLTDSFIVTHNTELAKQIANAMGLTTDNPLHFGELFVTPDISKEEAFYRWNDALRLIDMQLISGFSNRMGNEEIQRVYEQVSDNTYSPRYLDLQVLVRACAIPYSTVCLVDEIDKAYHEFDNYLLGVVDQNHFIVPEFGRVGRKKHDAATAPIFVLTSNMTRALSGPLVRRCKAVFYDYLDETLEAKVIHAKTGMKTLDSGKVAAFFKKIRRHEKLRLQQPPSTAEVIETARAITEHNMDVTEQNLFKLHGHWIKYRVDYIELSRLFLRPDGFWAERLE